MARKPIQEQPEFIELQEENNKLRRLLDDSVRFIFLVGPALSPLTGELGMMVPTSDLQGVTVGNTHVTVLLRPSVEEIVFSGVGTNHRLAITAPEGKITAEQSQKIAFMMFAIKEVRRRKPDPMLLGEIDAFAQEVMTGV